MDEGELWVGDCNQSDDCCNGQDIVTDSVLKCENDRVVVHPAPVDEEPHSA